MRSRNRLSMIAAAWVAAMALSACASIPKEAPELSGELGKRISAMELAHLSLFHRYTDEKRARIDEFVYTEWAPLFTRELFADERVAAMWNEAARGTAEDRVELMQHLGPRIQDKITAKRAELMLPVDEFETVVEEHLRGEYIQMLAINNAITSFLASAAEVEESRDRFLNMVGVQDELSQYMAEFEGAVTDVTATVESIEGQAAKVEAFKDHMRELIRAVSSIQ